MRCMRYIRYDRTVIKQVEWLFFSCYTRYMRFVRYAYAPSPGKSSGSSLFAAAKSFANKAVQKADALKADLQRGSLSAEEVRVK